jgi:hypothetical protein
MKLFHNSNHMEKSFLKIIQYLQNMMALDILPQGTDGYLIKIASTQNVPVINANVNSFTMAGTLNTNKTWSW